MNEGVVFGYVRSTSSGAPLVGSTVTLDRIETTQEINMGRLKLYDVYEQELVPPRAPQGTSGRDGKFTIWFRWDETDASVLAGPGGQRLTYSGRVLSDTAYNSVVTTNVWRFLLHNMHHQISPTRILGAAGAPSPSNMGPPGVRVPFRSGIDDAPSDQLFNFLVSAFTGRVDTRFDPGAARTGDNYWLVAFTNVLYVPNF